MKIGTCSLKLKGPLQGPILVPEKWLEAIGLPIFEEQSKIALGSATRARRNRVVRGPWRNSPTEIRDPQNWIAVFSSNGLPPPTLYVSQSRPSKSAPREKSFNCKPSSMTRGKVGTLKTTRTQLGSCHFSTVTPNILYLGDPRIVKA